MEEQGVGLYEAIQAVRSELNAAVTAPKSEDQRVGFKYTTIEIELELAITRGAEGGGGVRFWVVSADTKGTWSNEQTHRIRVVLEPYDLKTEEPLFGDENFR